VSIPGKFMLAGEYGVLYGGSCLATTLDHQMVVLVSPRRDEGFQLKSDLWPEPLTFDDISQIEGDEPAIASLRFGAETFGLTGAELKITSTLCGTSGFGSSSAVRLGVLLGLSSLAKGKSLEDHEIWSISQIAIEHQRSFQKNGSGYDFITQVKGGLLHIDFAGKEPSVLRLAASKSRLSRYFHPMIGGVGNKTGGTVKSTLAWLQDKGKLGDFSKAMEKLVQAMLSLLVESDEALHLRRVLKTNRVVQSYIWRNPHYPDQILSGLSELPGFGQDWTFKTTGAGGEDAILLIGIEQNLQGAFDLFEGRGWSRLKGAFSQSRASLSFMGGSNV
jgi:mevalonate kinase